MMQSADPMVTTSLSSLPTWGIERSFYYRYKNLCLSKKTFPSEEIRMKSHDLAVLHFYGDKLNLLDWRLFARALKTDNMLETVIIKMQKKCPEINFSIDTEAKLKYYRGGPVLFTKLIYFDVMNTLVGFIDGNKKLQQLGLIGFPMKYLMGSLANAISSCVNLSEISFARSCIESAGCELVCNAVKYLEYIQKIDFSNCGITQGGAMAVAELIKTRHNQILWREAMLCQDVDETVHPCLYYISLSDNMIGDNGAKYIIEGLMDDSQMKEVRMENCYLTEKSVELLLKCLERNKNIRQFHLKRNLCINKELCQKVRNSLGKEKKIVEVIEEKLPDDSGAPNKEFEFLLKEEVSDLKAQLAIERELRTKGDQEIKVLMQKLALKETKLNHYETKYAAAKSADLDRPTATILEEHQPHAISATNACSVEKPKSLVMTSRGYFWKSSSQTLQKQFSFSAAKHGSKKCPKNVPRFKQRAKCAANYGFPIYADTFTLKRPTFSKFRVAAIRSCNVETPPIPQKKPAPSTAPSASINLIQKDNSEKLSKHVTHAPFIAKREIEKDNSEKLSKHVTHALFVAKREIEIKKEVVTNRQALHACGRKRNLQHGSVFVEKHIGDTGNKNNNNTVRKLPTGPDQSKPLKPMPHPIQSKTFITKRSKSFTRRLALRCNIDLDPVKNACAISTTDITPDNSDVGVSDKGTRTSRSTRSKFKELKPFMTNKTQCASSHGLYQFIV